MHYHIILTENCNLQCRYCYEKSMKEFDNGLEKKFKFDFSDPPFSRVEVEKLKDFVSKDSEAVLIFYGGEPLLNIPKIKEIMGAIDVPYRMQTNGIFLDKLEPEYLNRIGKILVSIDGDEERTDKNRGKGTYKKVIENVEFIRRNGYDGELVARMTIAQDCPDLYEQVLHLVKIGFDSVHWQLDAGFYKSDFEYPRIKKFFDDYNSSVGKLIEWWVSEIEGGKVHRLYPFVGIVESILSGQPTGLRCGAGYAGYAISTLGKVVACPIMNNIEDFKAGDLNSSPTELKKFDLAEECRNCEVRDLCGGRCMYWRKAKLWPPEGDEMICSSIKFYINKIKEAMPRIKKAVSEGIVRKEDFNYEKYFGPEIIP